MPGRVVRLVTVRERISRKASRELIQMVLSLDDARVTSSEKLVALRALRVRSEPEKGEAVWQGGFVMLSLIQIDAIWSWIRQLPPKDRPQLVRHAFDLVLCNLEIDSGMVLLTRDEFAQRMGVHTDEASKALSVLVRGGIIRREISRVAGMRGPGMAVYWVNPHAAWNGSLSERKALAKEVDPPLLRMMDGGRDAG